MGTNYNGGDGQKVEFWNFSDKKSSEKPDGKLLRGKITSKKQETPEFKRILRRIRQKSKVTEGAKFVENSSPILAVNDQKIASEVENRAVQNKIEVFEQLYAGQRKLSEESKLLKSKNKSRTNIKKKLQNFEKDG